MLSINGKLCGALHNFPLLEDTHDELRIDGEGPNRLTAELVQLSKPKFRDEVGPCGEEHFEMAIRPHADMECAVSLIMLLNEINASAVKRLVAAIIRPSTRGGCQCSIWLRTSLTSPGPTLFDSQCLHWIISRCRRTPPKGSATILVTERSRPRSGARVC